MSAASSRRVLFVDDVPEEADFYAEYLNRRPEFDLTTALSAEEALETLRGSAVDCLVSDSVHTTDGEPLVAVAKRTYPDLPVVLYSGGAPAELPTEVVDEYLQKGRPSDTATSLGALGDAVRELTDRADRQRSPVEDSTATDWRHLGTFDWADADSPSLRVIEALAERTGFDPVANDPLYDTVDPDALDVLVAHSATRSGELVVHLEIAETLLRVSSSGSVEYADYRGSEASRGDADR